MFFAFKFKKLLYSEFAKNTVSFSWYSEVLIEDQNLKYEYNKIIVNSGWYGSGFCVAE